MTLPVNQQASAMALQTFHTEFDGAEASLAARLVDDEPWFRGAEAATALGCKNPQLAIRTRVDDEDKTTLHNLGGCENLTLTNPNEGADVCISESGLYALIMRSKLPAAKLFKRWVLKEALPTIRRTGSYTAARSASPQLTDAQQWERRRAHLTALSASYALATAAGIPLGDAHHKTFRDAVHEVLLPPGQQQIHMMDAAEFLQRKGRGPQEVTRLASEFGRALKTASEGIGRAATANHHEFRSGSNDVQMYHAHTDAVFLDTVYRIFQGRDLHHRVCAAREDSELEQSVSEALRNSRGMRIRSPRRTR